MTVRRLPITSRTADLLHVTLEALGHVVVDDSPHVWFVQTHSKSHGGHHHTQLPAHEVILHAPSLRRRHPCMVRFSDPFQRLTDLLPGWGVTKTGNKYLTRQLHVILKRSREAVTQSFLLLAHRVLVIVRCRFGGFSQHHTLHAGAQERGDARRLLSSGAVHDDRI